MTLGELPNIQDLNDDKTSRRKSLIKLCFRLSVSVLVLLLVLRYVHFKELWHVLSSISFSTAASFFGLHILSQAISAFKWSLILRETGIRRSFPAVLYAYFTGMFVNAFAFGTVGGDLARAIAIRPQKGERAKGLATVVADRIHGLTVLLLIGLIAIAFVQPPVLGRHAVLLSVALAFALVIGWWLGPIVVERIFSKENKLGNFARQIAGGFAWRPIALTQITILSIVFHSIQISMHCLLAREFAAPIPYSYLFATVPLVNIASSLPISMNGIGVREGLYNFLFSPLGVSSETSVAFGAVWILTVTLVSALCGLIVSILPLPASLYAHAGEDKVISEITKLQKQTGPENTSSVKIAITSSR